MPGISLEKSPCEKKRRENQKGSEGGPTTKQVSLGVKDRGKEGWKDGRTEEPPLMMTYVITCW